MSAITTMPTEASSNGDAPILLQWAIACSMALSRTTTNSTGLPPKPVGAVKVVFRMRSTVSSGIGVEVKRRVVRLCLLIAEKLFSK